LIPSSS